MAMFKVPEVFAAGAALKPVTGWVHYNNGYTANILNIPQPDSIAYQRSSPIYYANGLKNALSICHRMIDENVHFQGVVRLAQKLIELGKTIGSYQSIRLKVTDLMNRAVGQMSTNGYSNSLNKTLIAINFRALLKTSKRICENPFYLRLSVSYSF